MDFYNLDAIISVGYRVKSAIATRFRIWATQRLREYIVKGFVLDDERLKNPDQPFDYFEELMRRIQDIRTSERRFYQKITDIYATSIDYDPTQEVSLLFFKTVQNKVHWAITGQTAAEIVHGRVDAAKPNLGLTNWRGAAIRKPDVAIAKNYLTEPELAALNNLVEQYLIFAQGQATRRVPMHMADWIKKLDAFLALNERDILTHAGRISHEMAQAKAELEYDKFKALAAGEPRPVDDDFDQAVKQLPEANSETSQEVNRSHERSRNQSRTHRSRPRRRRAGAWSRAAASGASIRSRWAASKATGGAASRSPPITCWSIATPSWPWSRPRRGMKH